VEIGDTQVDGSHLREVAGPICDDTHQFAGECTPRDVVNGHLGLCTQRCDDVGVRFGELEHHRATSNELSPPSERFGGTGEDARRLRSG